MSATAGNSFLKVGLIASVFTVVVSLAISAAFDEPTFNSWVGFIWMTAVPAQIIMGLMWHFDHPAALASLAQPVKGIAYLALTAVFMAIGGAFLYYGPGGAVAPGPFLIMATIISIVLAFWLVGVWQAWPFNLVFKHPVAAGLAVYVASYLLGLLYFRVFFDFSFLEGAPIYVAALDPKGLFGAWQVLSFSVTTVAAIMMFTLFGFWPATLVADKQPLLGLVVTLMVLAVAGAVYCLFNNVLGFDIVDYLVRVPVSFIFGVFLAANMMQFQLFSGMQQPVRGVALTAVAAILAFVMEHIYRAAIPYLLGGDLPVGAPAFQTELWVATAMLGITFPVINIVSGYFGFWPFLRAGKKAD